MPNSFSIRNPVLRGAEGEEVKEVEGGKEEEEIKEREEGEEGQERDEKSDSVIHTRMQRARAATFAVASLGAMIPEFTSHVNTAWAG
jgi:hypothetical protein